MTQLQELERRTQKVKDRLTKNQPSQSSSSMGGSYSPFGESQQTPYGAAREVHFALQHMRDQIDQAISTIQYATDPSFASSWQGQGSTSNGDDVQQIKSAVKDLANIVVELTRVQQRQ
jgi:uncharacterized protein YukE